MGGVLVATLPTPAWFFRNAWRPTGTENRAFVDYVRGLPERARIVVFAIDELTLVRFGRSVDFDFSPSRPDSYLPPEARPVVRSFWQGLDSGNPDSIDMLRKRYDLAIAPLGDKADARLSHLFARKTVINGYAIYDVHAAAPTP